jgi:hypothetical protein
MMILTSKMIANLRFQCRLAIDKGLEASLLRQFGVEPYPNEYSEQDMHEQVRKVVMKYNGLQEDSLSSVYCAQIVVEPGRG